MCDSVLCAYLLLNDNVTIVSLIQQESFAKTVPLLVHVCVCLCVQIHLSSNSAFSTFSPQTAGLILQRTNTLINPVTFAKTSKQLTISKLEFPGMAMSQRLNKMLLKRPRGRPSRLSNSMQSFQPSFGAHDNGRAVAIGGGNEGSMAGGYDGIPPNSSTPLLASDPSASAFEMNWMVNTGTSVDGRNLAETNNSLSFERTATSPSGRYPGEMGLFERMKRGKSS